MPTFAAIPTMYAGVQFRSRLEAKWAAFFDLIGWKWEYEPFDLPGYIPDFLIRDLDGMGATLAEVKPFDHNGFDTKGFEKLFEAEHPVYNRACLGVHPYGLYMKYEGNDPPNVSFQLMWRGEKELDALWKTAGNKVQWKGVQAK